MSVFVQKAQYDTFASDVPAEADIGLHDPEFIV
jgi:hypothetical protein